MSNEGTLAIRPIRSGWPTSASEYAPGMCGLDYAIGRRVIVHDWYGEYRGVLNGWDYAGSCPYVSLTLESGAVVPRLTLMATREITVEDAS